MEFADMGIDGLLALEAQRYLAVVEAFRREGREPHWRPEPQADRLPVGASPLQGLVELAERMKRCPD
jgi:hypothetical protein